MSYQFDLNVGVDVSNVVSLHYSKLEALLSFIIEELRRNSAKVAQVADAQKSLEDGTNTRIGTFESTVDGIAQVLGITTPWHKADTGEGWKLGASGSMPTPLSGRKGMDLPKMHAPVIDQLIEMQEKNDAIESRYADMNDLLKRTEELQSRMQKESEDEQDSKLKDQVQNLQDEVGSLTGELRMLREHLLGQFSQSQVVDDATAAPSNKGELVWFDDGGKEALGVIDESGVLRDLRPVVGNESTVSKDTLNKLKGVSLASLPEVLGDRKICGVHFSDGTAVPSGKVFKEGKEWSKGGVRFADGTKGNGKVLNDQTRWVSGMLASFKDDEEEEDDTQPKKKVFAKEKFEKGIRFGNAQDHEDEYDDLEDDTVPPKGELVYYDDHGEEKLGVIDQEGVLRDLSNIVGTGELKEGALYKVLSGVDLSKLAEVQGDRRVYGVHFADGVAGGRGKVFKEGTLWKSGVRFSDGEGPKGKVLKGGSERWVGGNEVRFKSEGGNGKRYKGDKFVRGESVDEEEEEAGNKKKRDRKEKQKKAPQVPLLDQIKQANSNVQMVMDDLMKMWEKIESLQNNMTRDKEKDKYVNHLADIVKELQTKLSRIDEEMPLIARQIDHVGKKATDLERHEHDQRQQIDEFRNALRDGRGANFSDGKSNGSKLSLYSTPDGETALGGGASLSDVISIMNIHDDVLSRLVKGELGTAEGKRADKSSLSPTDASSLVVRIDILEQTKADAEVVARKAENDYVDMAVDNARKEILRALNMSSGSIMDTLDKSLSILRDMLEGKANSVELQKLNTLIKEQVVMREDADTGDGLAGFRCLSCNKTLEGMRVRPMGAMWPNFTPHMVAAPVQKRNTTTKGGKRGDVPPAITDGGPRPLIPQKPSGPNGGENAGKSPASAPSSARLPPLALAAPGEDDGRANTQPETAR